VKPISHVVDVEKVKNPVFISTGWHLEGLPAYRLYTKTPYFEWANWLIQVYLESGH